MLGLAHRLLPYALASMWLAAIANVLLSALDGAQRSELRAGAMTSSALVQICVAYLVVPSRGLIGMGMVQLAQAAFLLLAAGGLAAYTLRQPLRAWLTWDRERLVAVVRYGGGVQVAAIGQLLFEPTLKALLAVFGGLSVTGYYEMANRAVTQFRAVIVSAYQMLVPYMASRAGREGLVESQMRAAYLASYRLLVVLATPYFALLAASLPLILTLWLGRYDENFVCVGMICLVGWYLNTMVLPAYMLYLAAGRLRWTMLTHVAIGLLSASLGGLGGWLWGGYGVLIGAMLALVLGSGIVVVAYHMEYQIGVAELLPAQSRGLLATCVVGVAVADAIILSWDGQGVLPTSAAITIAAMLAALTWIVCRHPVTHDLAQRWRNGARSLVSPPEDRRHG